MPYQGGTTRYESVEQMHIDLDNYLKHSNTQLPHQGRVIEGQSHDSMFMKSLKLIPKEVRSETEQKIDQFAISNE